MTYYREERRPPQDVENLFECQLQLTDGCDTVVHPHVHDYFEALYCIKGGYELRVGGARYPFSVGDMVLIDPNEVHQTRSTCKGINEYLVLKFMPDALLYADHPVYEMKVLLPYLWGGTRHRKLYEKKLLDKARIGDVLLNIHLEYSQRAFGYEMAVRSDLSRLFLWVVRTLDAQGGSQNLRHMDAAALMMLQRAFAYIDAHLAQEITMEDVALHCDMKYSSFSRFFSKYAQKSFPEYLTEARLKRASILLTTTDQSITDIAMSVGFSTSSYFIQRFRYLHGVAPGKFRKQFLSELTIKPQKTPPSIQGDAT